MLNPILSFSATRRMRSFRTMLIAAGYTLVLLAAAFLMMRGLFRDRVSIASMHAGVYCYAVLIAAQFVLLVLIAPAMTSGAIAGERERRTLELLLVTNTRSFRIVAGKLLESFAVLCLLIICGLPVMCLTMLGGGASLGQILLGEVFLLAVAFAAACAGIFASSIARSTVLAAVLSYVIILAVGLLTMIPFLAGYPQRITDVVYDTARYAELTPGGALKMISPVLMMNPAFALTAVLQEETQLLTEYMQYREHGRILCTWLMMDRAGCGTIALISSGLMAAAGFVLMCVSVLLVRPRRRKR